MQKNDLHNSLAVVLRDFRTTLQGHFDQLPSKSKDKNSTKLKNSLSIIDGMITALSSKGKNGNTNFSLFEFTNQARYAPHLPSLRKGVFRRVLTRRRLAIEHQSMGDRSFTPRETKDSPSRKLRNVIKTLSGVSPEIRTACRNLARKIKLLEYSSYLDRFYELKKAFAIVLKDNHAFTESESDVDKLILAELEKFNIGKLDSHWGCLRFYRVIIKVEKLIDSLNQKDPQKNCPKELQRELFYDFRNTAKLIADFKYRKARDSLRTQPNGFAKFIYVLEKLSPWLAIILFGLSFIFPPLVIPALVFSCLPILTQASKVLYKWFVCGQTPSLWEFLSSIVLLLFSPIAIVTYYMVLPVVKMAVNIKSIVRTVANFLGNVFSNLSRIMFGRYGKYGNRHRTLDDFFRKFVRESSKSPPGRLIKKLCMRIANKDLKDGLIVKLDILHRKYCAGKTEYRNFLEGCRKQYEEIYSEEENTGKKIRKIQVYEDFVRIILCKLEKVVPKEVVTDNADQSSISSSSSYDAMCAQLNIRKANPLEKAEIKPKPPEDDDVEIELDINGKTVTKTSSGQ